MTSCCDVTGVMVSNGNHPQMAELFSYFQVSELLQFSQMDILCIQYYYHQITHICSMKIDVNTGMNMNKDKLNYEH